MSDEAGEEASDEAAHDAFDLDARELCPDGSCTGVIGEGGRCKVCGRLRGDAAERTSGEPQFVDGEADEPIGASLAEADGDLAPSDFADRALCSDGSCIGVLDQDGRCKVCGRAAAS